MIIYFDTDVEKARSLFFFIRARSLVELKDLCVLNDTSLGIITPKQAFCEVYKIWLTSLYDTTIFVLLLERDL